MTNAFIAATAFSAAMFSFELFSGSRDWDRALERSFFGAWAIITYELAF